MSQAFAGGDFDHVYGLLFGNGGDEVKKWQHNPRFYIDASQEFTTISYEAINYLNSNFSSYSPIRIATVRDFRVEGIYISSDGELVVPDVPENYDVKIIIGKYKDFVSILNYNFISIFGYNHKKLNRKQNICSTSVYSVKSNGYINRGIIFIDPDRFESRDDVRLVLIRELVRVLGLMGHSTDIDSLLYSKNPDKNGCKVYGTIISELEFEVIDFLYKHLSPGDMEQDVVREFRDHWGVEPVPTYRPGLLIER